MVYTSTILLPPFLNISLWRDFTMDHIRRKMSESTHKMHLCTFVCGPQWNIYKDLYLGMEGVLLRSEECEPRQPSEPAVRTTVAQWTSSRKQCGDMAIKNNVLWSKLLHVQYYATSWALCWFSLEEERVMQQSSVSIYLNFLRTKVSIQ